MYHPHPHTAEEPAVRRHTVNRLTNAAVKAATCIPPDSHDPSKRPAPARFFDGGGLILSVTASGSKVWVQRLTIDGERHDYGLGSWPAVTLAKAREVARRNAAAAHDYRWAALRGERPRLPEFEARRRAGVARRNGRSVPAALATGGLTFAEAHEACILERSKHWKNPKTDLRSWRADLKTHLKDVAGLPVAGVDVFHVRKILAPLTPASAQKILRRLNTVFEWAAAGRLIGESDNPARAVRKTWAGLKREAPVHRKAMPWREVPAFFQRLTAGGTGADVRGALALVILTGVRAREGSGARWEEVDWETRTWTIEGSRMKDGRPHQVPLSEAACAVLRAAGPKDAGRVFASPRGKDVTDAALRALMAELEAGATVHGFRSSLRIACSEGELGGGPIAREVAEACLAHRPAGGVVEAAYLQDSTMLERRRREVMEPWGAFVAGGGR